MEKLFPGQRGARCESTHLKPRKVRGPTGISKINPRVASLQHGTKELRLGWSKGMRPQRSLQDEIKHTTHTLFAAIAEGGGGKTLGQQIRTAGCSANMDRKTSLLGRKGGPPSLSSHLTPS